MPICSVENPCCKPESASRGESPPELSCTSATERKSEVNEIATIMGASAQDQSHLTRCGCHILFKFRHELSFEHNP